MRRLVACSECLSFGNIVRGHGGATIGTECRLPPYLLRFSVAAPLGGCKRFWLAHSHPWPACAGCWDEQHVSDYSKIWECALVLPPQLWSLMATSRSDMHCSGQGVHTVLDVSLRRVAGGSIYLRAVHRESANHLYQARVKAGEARKPPLFNCPCTPAHSLTKPQRPESVSFQLKASARFRETT